MAFSRELIISIINLTITIIGVVSQFFGNFLADKLQKTIDEVSQSARSQLLQKEPVHALPTKSADTFTTATLTVWFFSPGSEIAERLRDTAQRAE